MKHDLIAIAHESGATIERRNGANVIVFTPHALSTMVGAVVRLERDNLAKALAQLHDAITLAADPTTLKNKETQDGAEQEDGAGLGA